MKMARTDFEKKILAFLRKRRKPATMKAICFHLRTENRVTISKYIRILESKKKVYSPNRHERRKLWSIRMKRKGSFYAVQ